MPTMAPPVAVLEGTCSLLRIHGVGNGTRRAEHGATNSLATSAGCRAGRKEIMLMTDLAVRDLESCRGMVIGSLRHLVLAVFGRRSDHHLPKGVAPCNARSVRPPAAASHRPVAVPRPDQQHEGSRSGVTGDIRWARHPQLRARQVDPVSAGSQRGSRLQAERGLLLAHGGRLIEAVEAFAVAAQDPDIDLGELPGFWDLPRNGMLTAVRAYERAGRVRDAAVLEARVRHLLKPRPLRPVPVRSERLRSSGT
jgi:hypothetical protein